MRELLSTFPEMSSDIFRKHPFFVVLNPFKTINKLNIATSGTNLFNLKENKDTGCKSLLLKRVHLNNYKN